MAQQLGGGGPFATGNPNVSDKRSLLSSFVGTGTPVRVPQQARFDAPYLARASKHFFMGFATLVLVFYNLLEFRSISSWASLLRFCCSTPD